MIKTPTGVKYSPQSFRELDQCVTCGKVGTCGYGNNCESCTKENLPKCHVCGIILREGFKNFYTYDIREEHRDGENELKASKECVVEFIYEREPLYTKISDDMCSGCINWKSRMKDVCMTCDNDFDNTEDNYKLNGNQCPECAEIMNIDYSFEEDLVSVKSLL